MSIWNQTAGYSVPWVRTHDYFRPNGCDCAILGLINKIEVTFCDLGSRYILGYGGCEDNCVFFPLASFNGGWDTCISRTEFASSPTFSFAGEASACPPLPVVSGVQLGAYFMCNYPHDWACFGSTVKNLANKLSTPDFPFIFNPACFDMHFIVGPC